MRELKSLMGGKLEIDFPPIYAWVVRLTMFFPARLIMWLTRRRDDRAETMASGTGEG